MKLSTLSVFCIAIAMVSCTKDKPVYPTSSDASNASSKSGSTTGGPTTVANSPDTVKFGITFKTNTQVVKTSVQDTVLTLLYTENINLVLNAPDYYSSWAVHLQDDFSKSILSSFSFTTPNSSGAQMLNWVDDNLNNVVAKTATDTVINNIKMVKLNVARKYTFFKNYHTSDAATAAQNNILTRQSDVLNYTANYYMKSGFTTTYSGSAPLSYTR